MIDFDDEPVDLVSGIGQRKLVEIQIQIAVGCHGSSDPERDCDRLGLIERRYYRNTFLQYQVHYGSQMLCEDDGVSSHASGLPCDTVIAFVADDDFNGPIRLNAYSLLHCGVPAPSFTRVALLGPPDPRDPDGLSQTA